MQQEHLTLRLHFSAIGYVVMLQYFKISVRTLVTQKHVRFQFVIRLYPKAIEAAA